MKKVFITIGGVLVPALAFATDELSTAAASFAPSTAAVVVMFTAVLGGLAVMWGIRKMTKTGNRT
jgi:hypothetical protein